MIILKVTKIRAPPPSLEDVFLEKPQVVSYWILPSPSLFRFKETKKHSTCKVTQIIDFPIMTPKQNADILLAMFVTFSLFEQISSNKLLWHPLLKKVMRIQGEL